MITVVNAIPVNKKGELLLTQRKSNSSTWNNKWQFAGGTMEFGEKAEQTLARELDEELDVSVRIIFPYPIFETNVWYKQDTTSGLDQHTNILAYLVDIGSQTPKINNEELKDWAWFPYEKALKLDLLPNVKDFIYQAQKIIEKEELLTQI